ncbi:hypothetical protein ACH4E7_29640 [Kitasatospora sp. NPDC018058]|uniref:hypothetical protein n=1 Tax=Kitasatospora sp. NPDC018058 TaxID=3364025 RepID=UPI0037BFEE34
MRRITGGVAALLAAASLLTACSSGGPSAFSPVADPASRPPTTEIALPDLDGANQAASPYPASTVTLSVGQRLGVPGGLMSMTAVTWELSSAGDGAVLRQGPDFITHACPANSVGCSPKGDQTFIAVAPGSTTLTWQFHNRGICLNEATAPALGCGNITKSIQVTVQ